MRNLVVVNKNDELFFVTNRDISKDEEILYWIDDPALIWSKKKATKTSELIIITYHPT